MHEQEAPAGLGAGETQQLTLHATERIRELILERRLLPGEKIRQVDLAQAVGVSRSPLREALRTLESEGVVTYETNRGYVVARLNASELQQIYTMRKLIENELLATLQRPTDEQLAQLTELNEQIRANLYAEQIAEILRANRAFHFTIFALSDKALYRREITRLWQLSEGYRATYLSMPDTRARIVGEHEQIIDALRDFDLDRLIEVSGAHRSASEGVVVGMLASP